MYLCVSSLGSCLRFTMFSSDDGGAFRRRAEALLTTSPLMSRVWEGSQGQAHRSLTRMLDVLHVDNNSRFLGTALLIHA